MRSLLFAGATRPDLVAKLAAQRSRRGRDRPRGRGAGRRQGGGAERRCPSSSPRSAPGRRSSSASTRPASELVRGRPRRRGGAGPRRRGRRPQGRDGRPTSSGCGRSSGRGRRSSPGSSLRAGSRTCERILAEACPEVAYFGAEDYIADLGGRRTAGGEEALFARSRVALAARVAGVAALDQVVVDFRDDAAFERDAEAGRAIGYRGKLCIHPAQVPDRQRASSAPAPRRSSGRERCSRPGRRARRAASPRSSSRARWSTARRCGWRATRSNEEERTRMSFDLDDDHRDFREVCRTFVTRELAAARARGRGGGDLPGRALAGDGGGRPARRRPPGGVRRQRRRGAGADDPLRGARARLRRARDHAAGQLLHGGSAPRPLWQPGAEGALAAAAAGGAVRRRDRGHRARRRLRRRRHRRHGEARRRRLPAARDEDVHHQRRPRRRDRRRRQDRRRCRPPRDHDLPGRARGGGDDLERAAGEARLARFRHARGRLRRLLRRPRTAVLGEPGRGFHQIMEAFQVERISLAGMALGLGQAALDEAVAHARERRTFGKHARQPPDDPPPPRRGGGRAGSRPGR